MRYNGAAVNNHPGDVKVPPIIEAVLDIDCDLPENLPMPEVAAEPDGSISLDWIASRFRMFSVSVGANNRVAYAWLDGSEKGHAVAVFDGLTIPPNMRNGIESIVCHVHNAFRFA